jgi:alpha-N-arabinofuranosidase
MQYTNPILPGFYPDPSICRVGEDYYLVTSSFEYFPGVPLFHSRDLVHWRQIGHCLTRTSQLPLGNAYSSGGIFAPTIRYYNGTFYMVTTNVSDGGNFYVYTQHPEEEWSDPVWITPEENELKFAIDPSLFFDEDGKVYFTCAGPGQKIYQFEIDITTGKALSKAQIIWPGTGGKYPEGPHLYKINGLYYLLAAEGGTEYGHLEVIARANSPWGPFEGCPHNPILTHRSTEHPIQATGHADLIQAHNGSWWLVFLAVRPHSYPSVYHLGRETYLAPVQWTSEGWPIVGKVDLVMDADLLPQHLWDRAASHRDEFDSALLGMEWNFRRNPDPASWSLTDRPGWLRLTGSAATLDDKELTTFIGRRQQHFQCSAAVCLDYQGDGEAGLTVLMNERHHYEIFVQRIDGTRHVLVRRRIGSLVAIVAQEVISDGVVILRIQADQELYRFIYSVGTQEPRELTSGETRYLSTEVAGGFTGVYFGMYVQGTTPADFDWFEYEPL